MTLNESREWSLTDGVVRHTTGRFFELRGYEWSDSTGNYVCSPFVNQPEVGILGMLVSRRDDKLRVLMDAKFEPGNVFGVDVAPCFQATRSNFERAHGGSAPALSETFLTESNWHSGVKQSEQGTRFMKKWNENVIIIESGELEVQLNPTMRWHTTAELRELLLTSHALNTDARSVIATSDWNLWISDGDVRADESHFARAIRESLAVPPRDDVTSRATHALTAWAHDHPISYREVPLVLNDGKVAVDSAGEPTQTQISHVRVATDSRERSAWDQPLISNPVASEEVLLCALDKQGIPQFFFTPVTEVGLSGAQFGTSLASFDPARSNPLVLSNPVAVALRDTSTLLTRIEQSDEGGRFNQQRVTYSIRLIDDMSRASELAPSGEWFAPSEINELAQQTGFFTNEARSSLSLVVGLS